MFAKFMANFRRPRGIVGSLVLSMMNVGHGPMTKRVVADLNLRHDDVVLDIGCGGGAAIALMSATADRVFGVDYSKASIKKAIRKNRNAVREGRVALEVADVHELRYPDNSFTLVTAFETIYFWNRIEECFSTIHSILKPGGRFVIAMEAWVEESGKHNFPGIFSSLEPNLYSVGELNRLAIAAGFDHTTVAQKAMPRWLCMTAYKSA